MASPGGAAAAAMPMAATATRGSSGRSSGSSSSSRHRRRAVDQHLERMPTMMSSEAEGYLAEETLLAADPRPDKLHSAFT